MKKIICLELRNLDVQFVDDWGLVKLLAKYITLEAAKGGGGLTTTIRLDSANRITQATWEYTDSEPKDLPSTTALPS
jgi:hypothetical protein